MESVQRGCKGLSCRGLGREIVEINILSYPVNRGITEENESSICTQQIWLHGVVVWSYL